MKNRKPIKGSFSRGTIGLIVVTLGLCVLAIIGMLLRPDQALVLIPLATGLGTLGVVLVIRS